MNANSYVKKHDLIGCPPQIIKPTHRDVFWRHEMLDLPLRLLSFIAGDGYIPNCSRTIKVLLWAALVLVVLQVLILVVRLLT